MIDMVKSTQDTSMVAVMEVAWKSGRRNMLS